MRMAIGLATENVLSGRGGPFGAVIVKDGAVIATGANQVTATNDPTAHAEMVAIRNACKALSAYELRGCAIYSSCEPCPMCLTAILWARCEALYFGSTAQDAADAGFDDSRFYEQIRRTSGDRELRTANMLRDEACESFEAWTRVCWKDRVLIAAKGTTKIALLGFGTVGGSVAKALERNGFSEVELTHVYNRGVARKRESASGCICRGGRGLDCKL